MGIQSPCLCSQTHSNWLGWKMYKILKDSNFGGGGKFLDSVCSCWSSHMATFFHWQNTTITNRYHFMLLRNLQSTFTPTVPLKGHTGTCVEPSKRGLYFSRPAILPNTCPLSLGWLPLGIKNTSRLWFSTFSTHGNHLGSLLKNSLLDCTPSYWFSGSKIGPESLFLARSQACQFVSGCCNKIPETGCLMQ